MNRRALNLLVACLVLVAIGCGREGISPEKRESYVNILNIGREGRDKLKLLTDRARVSVEIQQIKMAGARASNFGADPDAPAAKQFDEAVEAWRKADKQANDQLVEFDNAMRDLRTALELDAPLAAEKATERIMASLHRKITFTPPAQDASPQPAASR